MRKYLFFIFISNKMITIFIFLSFIKEAFLNLNMIENIENQSFDLEYGVGKNFTNIVPGKYYFYIKARQNQTLDISFTKNNGDINRWIIYEIKEKLGSPILNNSFYPKRTINVNKNIVIDSYSYKCIKLETNYIKIEFPLTSITKYMFGLITCKMSYNLDNGVPKTINNFERDITYFLLLERVKFGQKVNINLSMKYINDNPFKEIYINEYSSQYPYPSYKYNITIESKIVKNNLLNITLSFPIKYKDTSSFDFGFNTNYNIDNIIVNIESKYICYYFINGIPQNISDFITTYPYFFYINAKNKQQAIITLDMSINYKEPFNLDIYEYEQLDYKSNNYIKESSNKKYTVNNYKIEYTYSVSSDKAKYISFCISPSYYIKYISIKIEVGGEAFDLNNGFPINGLNLTARFPYYFSIQMKQYQKANFIISIDKNNILPLNEIYISNYKYIPSTKIEGNKKIISTSYELLSYSRIIDFYIKPTYDVYDASVIINVGGESFDLENSISKSIKNLKSGYPYIFFLNINQYQLANVNITLNNVNKNSSNIINIQERKSETNIRPNISSINNNTIISFSYLVSDSFYSKNLELNLTPIIDINNLEIYAEVGGGRFECNNGFMKNFYNVKSGFPYYFFIDINQFENSSFILTMENTNSNPFDYLVLCECNYYYKITKNTTYNFKTKIENNKLVLHFSYFTNSTKTVAFLIVPKSNIDNLNVKINKGGGYYLLSNSFNYHNYTNIMSGKSYYFSINTTSNYYSNQIVNILFVTNYVNDNQINQIKIYESSSVNILSNSNLYKIDYIPSIKREKDKKKELVYMYSYTIQIYNTKFVIFQITPNYDIDNININYNFNSGYNKKTDSFTIGISCFFISLPLIIIIILTAFFIHKDDILKYKDKKKDSSLIKS